MVTPPLFPRWLLLVNGGFFLYCLYVNATIKLPKPHNQQKKILASHAKRRVLCAGRRGGKTTMIASYSVEQFLKGHRVIYGTPVNKQLKQFWGKVKKHFKPLLDAGFLYKNETEKYIKWARDKDADDGPMISAQTAYDAATWRGDWGDILIFDEYAFMNPDVWDIVGAPMMLDTDGEAWFISTPNRKNHFHSLFIRGLDDHDTRWQSFKFTSHDNPYLSQEALQEITQDMTQENYLQEIMAEFLENEGAVFRNIGNCINAPATRPEFHEGHNLVAGVDWGKHKDFTVICVLCETCRQEVLLDRFNKIDYSYQRGRLTSILEQWGIDDCMVELNSIGEPNFEELERSGLPVRGFQTTAASKRPLIEGLGLALEREEWQFLNVPIATAELEAYEIKVHPVTGHATYSAPVGVHDDTVMGRALAVQAVNSYLPAFL